MKDYNADEKIVNCLIQHITHPCIEPLTGLDIRYFYIKEAKKLMETIVDVYSRNMLERIILIYSNE